MNWDMLGHEWAVSLLKEHITRERLRHAYLITGPEGVGRRTLALRFAQALNCPQPPAPGEPCRTCRTCTRIERMQHPDLSVVQAEQRGKILKVEQVRELQRGLSLAPYEARYKIALLLYFEEANPSASNALLKTLEEPPPQVILVVTAESAEALLPTIVSRCEVLRLRPLRLDQAAQGLRDLRSLGEEQAQLLAYLSGGRPGFALRMQDTPEILEQRQAWLDDHARLLASGRVERFAYAEALSKDKDALRQALIVWLQFWRDVLLSASGASVPLANQDRSEEIVSLARRIGLERARCVTAAVERTLLRLDRNVNTRLAFEVLLLDLPFF